MGVMSVMNASRGASRTPLPTRSDIRANNTMEADSAIGNSSLLTADRA